MDNGRPTVVAPVKTEISENDELKAKVKMLEHTIVQMKSSKEKDRERRNREDYH